MPQAFVVSSGFPDISYTATDFDPHVIASCARLPLLLGIHKFVFDVTRDDLGVLQHHDLAVSWSLEFSLSDEQLVNLFAACRTWSVPYLLCTHTAIGPIGYLRRSRLMKMQAKKVPGNGHRMLGWLRSAGEIARLARPGGHGPAVKGSPRESRRSSFHALMIRISAIDHVNLQGQPIWTRRSTSIGAFSDSRVLEAGRGIPTGDWAIVGLPGVSAWHWA
jgi:hypothetical protein